MKLSLSLIFLICIGLSLCAEDDAGISVTNVRTVSHWPWEDTVDVYYTVNCDQADAVISVSFSGYNADTDETVPISRKNITGDGFEDDKPLALGKEMHAVWNAGADLPKNYCCEQFAVNVTASCGKTYLVVDLSGGSTASSYPYWYTDEAPDTISDTCRTTELWLRRIPAGTFTMGSPTSEMGRSSDETQHEVTLTQDYYIGVFECTQKQWTLVMGSNPSGSTGDMRPVEDVSYNDVRGGSSTAGGGWPTYGHTVDSSSFMGKLQAKTGLTFDLPTEAQWEYACRKKADGTCWTTALNSGKAFTAANLSALGRYSGNSSSHTKVGSYLPSELGLYDMHGNVCEWVLDKYGSYPTAAVSDPVGATSGTAQIKRGGSYNLSMNDCRAAVRRHDYSANNSNADIGFRIACEFPSSTGGSSSGEDPTGGETSGGETTEGEASSTDFGDFTYLVVDLSGGSSATSYPVRYTSEAPDITSDVCRTTELWLRRIPAGSFTMGSPEDETGRFDDETQFQVTLSQDYYIGVFECTQAQYQNIMGSNPSSHTGITRPVDKVSYNTIRGTGTTAGAGWPTYGHAVDDGSFMGKLQAKTGLTFDLPTEAQWEYACRKKADGTCWTTSLNSGKNVTTEEDGFDANVDEVGRYWNNGGSSSQHAKVGSYLPSELGLYDMHGNVEEWCLDWYDDYPTTLQTDYTGPSTGSDRVFRSGAWNSIVQGCRAASRDYSAPSSSDDDYGFRVACVPAP